MPNQREWITQGAAEIREPMMESRDTFLLLIEESF